MWRVTVFCFKDANYRGLIMLMCSSTFLFKETTWVSLYDSQLKKNKKNNLFIYLTSPLCSLSAQPLSVTGCLSSCLFKAPPQRKPTLFWLASFLKTSWGGSVMLKTMNPLFYSCNSNGIRYSRTYDICTCRQYFYNCSHC